MYNEIAPMFLVDDVDGALGFYKDVFGAKLQHNFPDKPPFEWVSLLLENTEIMFWKKVAAQKEYPDLPLTSDKPSNVIIYVYVEDVDKLYERIEDKVTIVMKPKDQFYGIREFTVSDPFDIVWTFAQDIQ